MAVRPDWLPALVLIDDYGGVWGEYVKVLYAFFEDDFVRDRPMFKGNPLALKRHPLIKGKEATFWHLISEGLPTFDDAKEFAGRGQL